MIEVQNLSFAYGSRPILQNVSFSLEQGECVAVTIANLLSLQPPSDRMPSLYYR